MPTWLHVSVDGLAIAKARARDHAHRPLPVWQGCHTLKCNEIFLLNPAAPDSFDGRYFGDVPLSTVMARAEPLWTESAHEAARRIPPNLVLAFALLWVGAAKAAPAPTQSSGDGQLDSHPSHYGSVGALRIPPSWIRAVMQVESGGNRSALSPKGAIGLMQIMPATWETLRQRYRLGADPYDVHDNILAGTASAA